MEKSIGDFFKQRLGHSFDSRFSGMQGTFQFVVKGDGNWHLAIDHGNLDLFEGQRTADCTILLDDSDLSEIINGRRNFVTAFLQGRSEVKGDRALAAGIHTFFRKAA